MPGAKDDVAINERIKIALDIAVGPPQFSRVKVQAEDGLFKNGQQYSKGDEFIMEATAAERFAQVGEVQILGEAEAPKEAEDAQDV